MTKLIGSLEIAAVLVAACITPALAGGNSKKAADPAPPRQQTDDADAFARPMPDAETWQTLLKTVEAADLPAGDEVRLDSSTSAQPIAMASACALYGLKLKWNRYGWNGEFRLIPRLSETGPAERARQLRLPSTSGTHGAYVRLINGEADLTIEARKPSEDELKLMKDKGVELAIKPIARDAFVFIVNHQNKVQGLKLQQVRDIYTGKITRWDQVGGDEAAINAYQRNRNSGSQVLMERLVMNGADMIERRAMSHMSMMGPINAMNRDAQGLGFTVHYYERFMAPAAAPRSPLIIEKDAKAEPEERPKRRLRRMLAINGVEPTPETIASGKYPLTCPVYVAIRKDAAAASPARKLRDWLLSHEGRKLVKAVGYLPLERDDAE